MIYSYTESCEFISKSCECESLIPGRTVNRGDLSESSKLVEVYAVSVIPG